MQVFINEITAASITKVNATFALGTVLFRKLVFMICLEPSNCSDKELDGFGTVYSVYKLAFTHIHVAAAEEMAISLGRPLSTTTKCKRKAGRKRGKDQGL